MTSPHSHQSTLLDRKLRLDDPNPEEGCGFVVTSRSCQTPRECGRSVTFGSTCPRLACAVEALPFRYPDSLHFEPVSTLPPRAALPSDGRLSPKPIERSAVDSAIGPHDFEFC